MQWHHSRDYPAHPRYVQYVMERIFDAVIAEKIHDLLKFPHDVAAAREQWKWTPSRDHYTIRDLMHSLIGDNCDAARAHVNSLSNNCGWNIAMAGRGDPRNFMYTQQLAALQRYPAFRDPSLLTFSFAYRGAVPRMTDANYWKNYFDINGGTRSRDTAIETVQSALDEHGYFTSVHWPIFLQYVVD